MGTPRERPVAPVHGSPSEGVAGGAVRAAARGSARRGRAGCRGGPAPRPPRCRRWARPAPARARAATADPPVGGAGSRAERGQVDAVGGAEERLVAVGVRRGALLEGGEDRAAVVVDDDDREVGPLLARAEHQAVRRRGGTSRRPSGPGSGCCRGRPRAAPIAVETVPSMPDRPRLASTLRRSPTAYGATIRSRSRTGLEAPTTSSPSGGRARLTAPATSWGVSSGSAASSRSSCRDTDRSAARHSSSHAGSSACVDGRPAGGEPVGDRERPALPDAGAARRRAR